MIQLEYDVSTADLRVSFVVDEGTGNIYKLSKLGWMSVDVMVVPQTVETLNIVARLINKARQDADEGE